MPSHDVDHSQPVGFIAACRNRLSENDLFIAVMHGWIELKFGSTVRILNRPARERTRDGQNVLLRIAAIHTKCVQFEKFASVVFIESRTPPPTGSRSTKVLTRSLRLPVIQVIEHRGVASRCQEHVFEASKNKRPD